MEYYVLQTAFFLKKLHVVEHQHVGVGVFFAEIPVGVLVGGIFA